MWRSTFCAACVGEVRNGQVLCGSCICAASTTQGNDARLASHLYLRTHMSPSFLQNVSLQCAICRRHEWLLHVTSQRSSKKAHVFKGMPAPAWLQPVVSKQSLPGISSSLHRCQAPALYAPSAAYRPVRPHTRNPVSHGNSQLCPWLLCIWP